MAIKEAGYRSRRALLGAGLGAVAATAVNALGRAAPTMANNGDPIWVGGDFTGVNTTKITTDAYDAFRGRSTFGAGVVGYSASGIGVVPYGEESTSNNSAGVLGRTNGHYSTIGVIAEIEA